MSSEFEKTCCVPAAFVSPIILSLVFLILGFSKNEWLFVAVPFSLLGTICSSPNMNLANGCLVLIAIVSGFALSACGLNPLGFIIVCSSLIGWALGSVEKRIRMRPVEDKQVQRSEKSAHDVKGD